MNLDPFWGGFLLGILFTIGLVVILIDLMNTEEE